MDTTGDGRGCSGPGCGCGDGGAGANAARGPSRREFVQLVGLGALGAAAPAAGRAVTAGPFDDVNDYLDVIPRDKRLADAWVASLAARGTKAVYRDREALRKIGMPVGGLFAGTVYLGGDGRLWLWDVFNEDQEGVEPRAVKYRGAAFGPRDGANYVAPAAPESPIVQGFLLEHGGVERRLSGGFWTEVTFEGRYPTGRVSFRDPTCPLWVDLEAFSPFCPGELDDSSFPLVVLSYTVHNPTDRPAECALRGWVENPVARESRGLVDGVRVNRVVKLDGPALAAVVCTAEPPRADPAQPPRPDVAFADFEAATYQELGWTAEGTAFGAGPVARKDVPAYQGDLGGQGDRVVNSHASAPGRSVGEKDAATGTLTSPPFKVERPYIHFLIGGGKHPGQTCLNLLVDGQVVATATGRDSNAMAPGAFSASEYLGKTARLQVVDRARGGWGNVGVDRVVFSDRPPGLKLEERSDFGTFVLAAPGAGPGLAACARADELGAFDAAEPPTGAESPLRDPLYGGVRRTLTVPARGSATAVFLLAWHFPNFRARGLGGAAVGHWYASKFRDALDVARAAAARLEELTARTKLWADTWYDSTLPFWLLDRTMANTSTLATTTCYRFKDGRFWAWEGVGCCEGTCTHVWHYAQSPARLFPELERDQRRRVDFGLAQHADGGVGMRAGLSAANEPAHDGQCGRILGAYREHLMSADDTFLKAVWPGVKKAVQYMMARDADGDGLVDGPQPNTLDAAWYGQVSSLASLYLAALRAGEAMAAEAGDEAFADRCRAAAGKTAKAILTLYNGEYFVQREDPAHADAIGVGPGCFIDQVFGQTWAHWVNLGTLFDRDRQLSALRALWSYNFAPDVGPFRDRFPRGRWYAVAGEAGLLMATWPRGGQNPNARDHWQYMYFNECMTGFEWQAAAHMIYEGHDQPDLLQKGLAVARAVHDRYDAILRNPYNEVECSDHYARAMASYGVFLAVCGFEHHGPKGHLGFAPRLTPDDFRAPFTAAGGWGTYAQTRGEKAMAASVAVKHGRVRLRTLAFAPRDPAVLTGATVTLAGAPVPAALRRDGNRVVVTLARDAVVEGGKVLEVELA